jgi:uncharacterized membrane protein
MTLESSKTLGGIGALLLFVAATLFFVSLFGGLFLGFYGSIVLGAVGLILVLVGLYGLADYYKERKIFNQSLFGIIIAVIGIVIAVVVLASIVLTNISPLLSMIYPGWNGDLSTLPNVTPDPSTFNPSNIDLAVIMPFFVGVGAFWIIIWITAIITTFLVRRSVVAIADKSTVKLFSTAGLIMLIGGFLGLVVVGYFLVLVGVLLLAVAFFQLKPAEPVSTMAAPPLAPVV